MISGFVIFMSLEAENSIKHFIIGRFSRLYPTYWISIIITLSFTTLFPLPLIENHKITDIIFNLTMIQGFLKIPHVDGVYWSLGIELLFYTFMGILYVTNQLKRIELISILWLFLVVIYLVFDFKYRNYIHVIFILDFIPLFIAGIMFYKLKFKTTNYLNHLIIILSLIIYLFSLHEELLLRPKSEMNMYPFIFI